MAWEVKKDSAGSKFMFCYVSGGYVMIGTREKNNPLNTSSDSCYVEEFSTHSIQNTIKTEMGEKVYKEILEKVQKVVADRNKKTSSPQIS